MSLITTDPLLDHFTVGDGCWEWNAAKQSNGYGRVTLKRKQYAAHRVVYELLVGPIPAGMQLDHLCRNRACVRPKHLEPVSPRENLLRADTTVAALNSGKTQCPRGHGEYDYFSNGRRHCSTCRQEACRRFQERKKRTG